MKPKYQNALVKLAVGVGATTVASAAVTVGAPALAHLLSPSLLVAASAFGLAASGIKDVAVDSAKKTGELLCQDALSTSWEAVRRQLSGGSADDGLPSNHDLLRAVRRAWLLALQHCFALCRADLDTQRHALIYDASTSHQVQRLEVWVKSELESVALPDYFDKFTALASSSTDRESGTTVKPEFESIFESLAVDVIEGSPSGKSRALFHDLFSNALDTAVEELKDIINEPVLGSVLDWIHGYNQQTDGDQHLFGPGWRLAAAAFFAELVKHDQVLGAAVLQLRIEHQSGKLQEVISGLGSLAERIAELDRRVEGRLPPSETNSARRTEILAALTAGREVDSLAISLQVAYPRGTRWTQTSAQVRETLARLQRRPSSRQKSFGAQTPFVGRIGNLSKLDNFLGKNARGLIILTAPPGYGKSSLLAAWIKQRSERGDAVARHFISTRYDATRGEADVVGHLTSQITDVLGLPDLAPPGIDAARQYLHKITSSGHFTGQRKLLIVIDGLDEARTAIQPFLENDVAHGVYVVVSCRANIGSWPVVLQPWRDRQVSLPFERLDLNRLTESDVEDWVDAIAPARQTSENSRRLAKRLWKASDQGIALFLAQLLDDLDIDSSQSVDHDFKSGTPISFSAHLHEEFQRLSRGSVQELHEVWTDAHQWLMAILCVAKGPLAESDLRQLLLRLRASGEAINSTSPALLLADHRLARWLHVDEVSRPANGRRYSLAHPLLAEPIASQLAELPLQAKNVLVQWADNAWRNDTGSSGYALDWLPAQLMEVEPSSAVRLLHDRNFLLARLREAEHAADRLAMAANEWSALTLDLRSSPKARAWTAFWSENEAVLVRLAKRVTTPGRTLEQAVRDCLGDSAIPDESGNLLPPRASRAHAPLPSALLRSVEGAHSRWVTGLLKVDGELVTWGEDGALKWWTTDGRPLIERGGTRAHKLDVIGVLSVDCYLVSWGREGGVRWWSRDGELLVESGSPEAHSGEVLGLTEVSNFVLSWGLDGTIKWWSLDGRAVSAGHGESAHAIGRVGLLALSERLVSWGEDGAVRWWTVEGLALINCGDAQAHSGGVHGALVAHQHVVTWGADGSIRRWDTQGSPLHHLDIASAHYRAVRGVLMAGETLVSWGYDGAIRWWSLDGRALPNTQGDYAHSFGVGGVQVVGDHLVSWGNDRDGSLRWWTMRGQSLQGRGDHFAHKACVHGVLVEDKTLYSWSWDGSFRRWSLDGVALPEVSGPRAHEGWVLGVLPVDGKLVSWGYDGTLRWWDPEGRPWGEKSEARSHQNWIHGVLELELQLVSWGADGALLWWKKDTEALPDQGSHDAHDYVLGALAVDNCVVSWGGDGSLYWWTREGQLIPGRGSSKAHAVEIRSVVLTPTSVVSCSSDGTVRWWTREGDPFPQHELIARAHDGWAHGALWIDEFVVTWGGDGAVRWWTCDGQLLPDRGLSDAHQRSAVDAHGCLGAFPVGGLLVSWGSDGAILWWTRDGRTLPNRKIVGAHKSWVWDVFQAEGNLVSRGEDAFRVWSAECASEIPLSTCEHLKIAGVVFAFDRLVSWSLDGSIRWWSLSGKLLSNAEGEMAHYGAVLGVVPTTRGLVSWGADGVLRAWTIDGDAIGALAVPGGARIVQASADGRSLIVGSRQLWVYDIDELFDAGRSIARV